MKVCFIGTGSIGTRHIKNLIEICKEEGTDLQIHVFRETARPLSEALRLPCINEIHEYDALDKWYDVIFICNPTFMHYDTLLRFLPRSDSFFIEKPVFETMDKDLSALKTDGKQFYVACPLRHTAVVRTAPEILKDQKVVSVRAICSSYLPDWRPGVDYRTVYSAKKEEGGGVRIDLIHEWDYLTALFGEPVEVDSFSGTYSDLEISSEDLAIYIARYPDKLLELHLDYVGRKSQRYFEVMTNEHVYRFDILNKTILVDGEVLQVFDVDGNDMYIHEMKHFISVMRKEQESANTIEHAIMAMKIAESR